MGFITSRMIITYNPYEFKKQLSYALDFRVYKVFYQGCSNGRDMGPSCHATSHQHMTPTNVVNIFIVSILWLMAGLEQSTLKIINIYI